MSKEPNNNIATYIADAIINVFVGTIKILGIMLALVFFIALGGWIIALFRND